MEVSKGDCQLEYEQILAEKVRLEQQNKLKDKLLHMIGHDLRSPLGSIKMILDFVDQKIIDPQSDDFQSMLPELADAADEAFYLLENLLYWTRIQTRRVSSQPEKYQVKQLVDKAITTVKRSFEQKGIKLTSQIRGDYNLLVDEYLFLVIFRNLLSNACKFSKGETEVTIGLSESAGHTTLYIRDQGIGISDEDLQKIRDPFNLFHTYGTNNETGNGLGLKVSDSLVRISKGQLIIESEQDKGTTVSVVFPT
ncbi:MAG: HAMP domain-containing sensor histidine kinase [Prolixibacteraceae bacterium]